ncbi:MAG: 3-deoxy-D-manno-octulosonic acid transferase [Candidatus Marinimicrobia bacterium]|nr:3-deoxy-D-manno-octulosonic acid transferase [Candidatus Neomarinimicrobiota bacterium]
MIWLLYNLLFLCGFLLLLPRFLWRMARRGGYTRHFMQRFGCYAPGLRAQFGTGRIWIHGVSVGEVMVALRFMDALRAADPAARFILSTNTSTGHALAARRLLPRDVLIYFPLDLPWIVRRVLDRLQPRLLLLVECELWPNLLRAAHIRGLPVALVNGRLSARSHAGYRRGRFFTRRFLPWLECACMQSPADAERLCDLGAPPGRVHVVGSMKYEESPPDAAACAQSARCLAQAGFAGRRLLLAGSTWPGEEEILLDLYLALRAAHPDLALGLAPRHVERCPALLRLLPRPDLTFVARSNSETAPRPERPDVFLLDTTGELLAFYAQAEFVFVGKSLAAAHGGQNPIEPALCGRPAVVGPHMENFQAVVAELLDAGALCQVADAAALCAQVAAWLADPAAAAAQGARARSFIAAQAGATARTLARLPCHSRPD